MIGEPCLASGGRGAAADVAQTAQVKGAATVHQGVHSCHLRRACPRTHARCAADALARRRRRAHHPAQRCPSPAADRAAAPHERLRAPSKRAGCARTRGSLKKRHDTDYADAALEFALAVSHIEVAVAASRATLVAARCAAISPLPRPAPPPTAPPPSLPLLTHFVRSSPRRRICCRYRHPP